MGLLAASIKICPNCLHKCGTGLTVCWKCKYTFTGQEVGNRPPIILNVEGNKPEQAEAERLSSIPFPRKPPTKSEMKRIVLYFIIGIIGLPICIVGTLMTWRGGPIVAGSFIIGAIVSLCLPIYSFTMLLRDARKKTPKEAFKWIWRNIYLEDTDFSKDIKKETGSRFNYEYAVFTRVIPEDVVKTTDKRSWTNNLFEIRKTLKEILEQSGGKVDLTCIMSGKEKYKGTWTPGNITAIVQNVEERKVSSNMAEVTGSILLTKYYDTKCGEDYCIAVSSVMLQVHEYYIINNNYCFPYDVLLKMRI